MKIELLKALCSLAGVSGFETPVREYLVKEWDTLLDDYLIDGMENLIGIVKSEMSPPPKLNILIMAHMDEVGLIVRDITDDGFIHFDNLGGQTNEVLTSQLWQIHTEQGPVTGYTGLESGHTMPSFPPAEKIKGNQLFIDIGATSRQEAEAMGVRTGLSITYGDSVSFNQNRTRILTKALDDRFALAVMTELLQELVGHKDTLPFNLYVAATTQEELGMRGSKVVYNSLPVQPDFVINLDIGCARDYPLLYSQVSSAPPTTNSPKLGNGMTITTHDSSMIINHRLIDFLTRLSGKLEIPYQLDSAMMSSTDACCLQRSGTGIPVVNMGIPVRYAHSHLSMMDSRDYDSLLGFLKGFCREYNLESHQTLFPSGQASKNGLFAAIREREKPHDIHHKLGSDQGTTPCCSTSGSL